MTDPSPNWIKDATVLKGSGKAPNPRPAGNSADPAGGNTIEIDFVPALRRLLGEEPGMALRSDLKTVLKLLSGTRMDMAKAAIIHEAIAETYREVLREAMGDGFEWKEPVKPGHHGMGEPT